MTDSTPEQDVRKKFASQAYEVEERLGQGAIDTGGKRLQGLCNTCKYLRFARDNLGNIMHSRCSAFDVTLDPRDHISECTEYWRRGQATLQEMVDVAKLLGGLNKYSDENLYR